MESSLSLPLTIRTTHGYAVLCAALIFLLFFVPGVLFTFGLTAKRPVGEDPQTPFFIGISLCLLGIVSAGCISIVYRKLPSTIISVEGIHSPQYAKDLIPWTSVSSVKVSSVRGLSYICLNVDFPPSIMTSASRFNRSFGFGDINISTMGTGVAFEEVQSLIEEMVRCSRGEIRN